jgi:hypothetical protein
MLSLNKQRFELLFSGFLSKERWKWRERRDKSELLVIRWNLGEEKILSRCQSILGCLVQDSCWRLLIQFARRCHRQCEMKSLSEMKLRRRKVEFRDRFATHQGINWAKHLCLSFDVYWCAFFRHISLEKCGIVCCTDDSNAKLHFFGWNRLKLRSFCETKLSFSSEIECRLEYPSSELQSSEEEDSLPRIRTCTNN